MGKPHYFGKILSGEIEKAYLLGFLWHDGYISYGRVGIEINPKDISVIKKLARAIDLDLSNVKVSRRSRLFIYKGEKNKYHSVSLTFGCKSMIDDLIAIGYTNLRTGSKNIPIPIKNLIEQAKLEDPHLWYETETGLTALAWLLGAYDADGRYLGGPRGYTGMFYSSDKGYLNEIKDIFEIKNDVKTKVEPNTVLEIFDKYYITKGHQFEIYSAFRQEHGLLFYNYPREEFLEE